VNTTDRTDLLVRHMSQFLRQIATQISPAMDSVVERLLRRTAEGHIALDLRRQESGADQAGAPLAELRESVLISGLAGAPGEYKPLILDAHDRLYLYRYWDYENRVADALRRRAQWVEENPDTAAIARLIGDLFEGPHVTGQKTAAAIAALRRLTVVSGGPGTGKTTAVVRILSLLLELNPKLNVALAAPTGKAAARAGDAVRRAEIPVQMSTKTRERIPREAYTLHRLLGLRPGYSRYHADNPLPYDVVVVDEASMVGVSLMARLLDALADDCRLILLGDKDQLSSVEPGSVLGDICSFEADYSPKFVAGVENLNAETNTAPMTHALQDCVARLTHSFRFGADSGIGTLAGAIRCGDADAALDILRDPKLPDVTLHEAATIAELYEQLSQQLLAGLRKYLTSIRDGADPATVLSGFESFRLLCAFRHGQTGVAGLNKLTEQLLFDNGLIDIRENWYSGRPVMVTSNDYMLQLFNGDIGVTIRDEDDDAPRVVFETQGGIRSLHTPRLPGHVTVFAMTVHKSQGSEFDDVALVLPEKTSDLLGRELIYTAVTRARHRVAIYGGAEQLKEAINRVQRRGSGLADKLRVAGSPGVPEQGSLF